MPSCGLAAGELRSPAGPWPPSRGRDAPTPGLLGEVPSAPFCERVSAVACLRVPLQPLRWKEAASLGRETGPTGPVGVLGSPVLLEDSLSPAANVSAQSRTASRSTGLGVSVRTTRRAGACFPDPRPLPLKRGVLTAGPPGKCPLQQVFFYFILKITFDCAGVRCRAQAFSTRGGRGSSLRAPGSPCRGARTRPCGRRSCGRVGLS